MGILKSFRIFNEKQLYPKNLVMFDFAKTIKNKECESINEYKKYEEYKYQISEKIFQANHIKLFKLNKAREIINKYDSLTKQIWGK